MCARKFLGIGAAAWLAVFAGAFFCGAAAERELGVAAQPGVRMEPGDILLTSVVDGEEVPLVPDSPVYDLAGRSRPVVSRLNIVLDQLEPPIAKGDKLGEAVFLSGGERIATIDLVSAVAVPERQVVLTLLPWLGWGLAGVFWVRLKAVRRRKRYIFVRHNRRIKL